MSHTADTNTSLALQSDSILHDNYIINSVLGEGGFGITYSATCLSTKKKVAIKEYFPSGIALRNFTSDKPLVMHPSGKLASSFNRGMQRFLNEASLLKNFQHLTSIVSVYDIFEENDTAYLVMEYIEGITLKQLVQNEGPLPFDELLSLMKPVLLDLHEVHKEGLIHRDISPDNLIIGMDNRLHVIDFGAASFSNPNESKTMTVILKSGYAPPEQYIPDGRTGAWTDVYALCATMYMVLTGEKPLEAVRRMQTDQLKPIPASTGIATFQAEALYKGLKLNSAERFATVKLLYQALTTPPATDLTETREATGMPEKLHKEIQDLGHTSPQKKSWRKPALAGVLCLGLYFAFRLYSGNLIGDNRVPEHTSSPTTEAAATQTTTTQTDAEDIAPSETASSSSQILTMINTVGISLDDARLALGKLDETIQIEIKEEYNDEFASGLVISQSISENTQFTKGQITQIQLVVSKGTQPAPATTERSTRSQATTQSSDGYTVKGSNDDEDGYTTIHLD